MEQIEEEIEYLSQEEIDKTLAVSNFSNIYYVYFSDNGEILSISNEKNVSQTNVLEIDYKRVEKFLSGKESQLNYRVALIDKTTLSLVKKTEDLVFSNSTLIFLEKDYPEDTALLVTWDKTQWIFNIQGNYKKQLLELGLSTNLMFFITTHDNENFLVRSIRIDMQELVTSDSIAVPFVSPLESNINKLAVSTKKFFDSYGLKINE